MRSRLSGEAPRSEVQAIADVRGEPGLHDGGMRGRRVQVNRRGELLCAVEEPFIRRIVEIPALAMAVDQSTDKTQFGDGSLQFGGRSVWVLRRQHCETAESVRVSPAVSGPPMVGGASQIDGACNIGLVLDARVEQRQDLEID